MGNKYGQLKAKRLLLMKVSIKMVNAMAKASFLGLTGLSILETLSIMLSRVMVNMSGQMDVLILGRGLTNEWKEWVFLRGKMGGNTQEIMHKTR